MKPILTTTLFLLLLQLSFAQQTGKVEYKHLGISFQIPDGWIGQEGDGVYLIASQTEPGLVLITTHEYKTLEELKTQARIGIQEANGTSLALQSEIEQLSPTAIGAVYSGTVEWQPAKCYAIGLLNPQGSGLTILAMAQANQYSDKFKNLAMQVKNSASFAKPETGPIVDQWKQHLSGVKLTYMESYSSPSYTDGGISGGYNLKKEIDLCSQGYFLYSGRNNMSMGSDVSSAYSNSKQGGHGQWEVAVNVAGEPVLKLTFYNGEVWEYTLSLIDEKVHLNGEKYFRTMSGEYAPNCY